MGQKTHPIGFRLGTTRDWQSNWFVNKPKDYRKQVLEDHKIRELIKGKYEGAAISNISIERGNQDLSVVINTARPGIVIGRGGSRIDELKSDIENLTMKMDKTIKKTKVTINEIRNPDLDAILVAANVAEQLERRVAYRRAIRQVASRTMQSGAKGIKILVSGRLGGADIARSDKHIEGKVPLHTLRSQIDFAIGEAKTTFGIIGIKVWIYLGDVSAIEDQLNEKASQRFAASTQFSGENIESDDINLEIEETGSGDKKLMMILDDPDKPVKDKKSTKKSDSKKSDKTTKSEVKKSNTVKSKTVKSKASKTVKPKASKTVSKTSKKQTKDDS
ncbi:MAG: 30S ribosomal protein S3 [Chloroflexi bacterium]|nr:30S ribosomal protein S3 [Chloroflexota bacterium]|tara:strand:- start:1782 stop:2777 length:996 start_codon:yes stop_codon:yes gene_type:complete